LAAALLVSNDVNEAIEAAVAAEQTSREHLRLLLAELPERQSLNYAATRPRSLDVILSASATSVGTSLALDQLIRSRALVLDEVAGRNRAPRDDVSDALVEELSAARRRLANLLVRGAQPGAEALHAELVDAARADSERIEQRLLGQSAVFRADNRREQSGLSEVQQAIPSGAALVSFVRYRSTVPVPAGAPPGSAGRRPPTSESYLAFIVSATGSPHAVRLGSAARIEATISEWRATMLPTDAVGSADHLRQNRLAGNAVRRLLWDPVAGHLAGVDRVFVVPDGSIALVPFAALPVASGAYLLETGPVVHQLSAERDLLPRLDAVRPAAAGLLALGGAAFGDSGAQGTGGGSTPPAAARPADPSCPALRSISFTPLPDTEREALDVASLWQKAPSAGDAAGPVRLLTRREATESTLKQQAGNYRVLHLATHGFFLNSACAPTPSGTRGVGGLSKAGATAPQNPLLLSGLALAGANRRAQAQPDEDDGILTAEEVAMLDLHGVEWAVLSACDTGVGEIRAGEGVFGLRRAFQVAGARTVIMSLWSVEDQATRAWMRALYEGRFQKGLSTADAVHQASLTVLRDRRARGQSTLPFFWAAFVAAGDWR
jgi:CHAT domain-containing protein